jgi:hypothetical protein
MLSAMVALLQDAIFHAGTAVPLVRIISGVGALVVAARIILRRRAAATKEPQE